uniref:DUF834 domain-containing protein n=1 Tax=Oryza meridionalis TaxID=40149 RepID=A0A0E0EL80_9ORYZ
MGTAGEGKGRGARRGAGTSRGRRERPSRRKRREAWRRRGVGRGQEGDGVEGAADGGGKGVKLVAAELGEAGAEGDGDVLGGGGGETGFGDKAAELGLEAGGVGLTGAALARALPHRRRPGRWRDGEGGRRGGGED